MFYVDYNSKKTHRDINEAFVDSIKTLLDEGRTVEDAVHDKKWLELTGCVIALKNPQGRVLTHPRQPMDIIGAVARFLWMARGDKRLEPIEFYVPQVSRFAVNSIIPGSCYGYRLRQADDGKIDQLMGVINRLKADPRCRQASAVIWWPIDAVRKQFDIPCAMSVSYHWRENGLYATTVMRSNKPATLLPFNVFEFTLFGELIAAELGTKLVGYTHIMNVAQLPHSDLERVKPLVTSKIQDSSTMPHMPSAQSPLEQIEILSELEERIRQSGSYSKSIQIIESNHSLNEYWRIFARILALRWLTKENNFKKLEEVVREGDIPEYFARPLLQFIELKRPRA
jgi:thymidylate synthase